jgi:arginyl-tRNA synthetase
MKDQIRKIILGVVDKLWEDCDLKLEEIEINKAPEKFGDYSTNIALKLARIVKENSLEIAEKINEDIWNIPLAHSQLEKTEVVKPGFVNFYFSQEVFSKTLSEIQKQGDKYGFSDLGAGKKVMVEFGQPNTHKAITVGH